jgi:hypothetical protein
MQWWQWRIGPAGRLFDAGMTWNYYIFICKFWQLFNLTKFAKHTTIIYPKN